jgi:hypothetical protein
MAAGWARAYDRYLRDVVKVTTSSPELARTALAVNPYAVIEPGPKNQAIVCFGTLCLAPIGDPEALRTALANRPVVQEIRLPGS